MEMPERGDLIAMIERVMNADGTEEELDQLLCELQHVSARTDVSDLIFYPKEELSAAEIADLMLSAKPILLPSQ